MVTEEQIINAIAEQERAIVGVKESYGYAKNPDNIGGKTPCVVHLPSRFESSLRAHHNVWTNTIRPISVLFVSPRQLQGGTIRYLENEAIPYGARWRERFQGEDAINSLFQATSNTVKVYLTGGQYAAGGPFLTFNDVEYIGWIFQWEFKEN